MDDKKQVDDLIVSNDGKLSDRKQTSQEALADNDRISIQTELDDVDTMSAPSIKVDNPGTLNSSMSKAVDISDDQSVPVLPGPVKAPEDEPVLDEILSDASALQESSEDNYADKRNNIGFTQSSLVSQLTPDIKSVNLNQKPIKDEVKSDIHPHRNNKIFGVAVTIIVALTLAGVAVFVYVSTQENTKKSNNINQTNPSQTQENSIDQANYDTDTLIQQDEESLSPIIDDTDSLNTPDSPTSNEPSDATTPSNNLGETPINPSVTPQPTSN